jgi:thioester reductase-like protein
MTPTSQKRLVLVGATGMVGGYTLRYALENAAVGTVTAIVRRKLGISHPKLQEVLHRDFADCGITVILKCASTSMSGKANG